MLRVFQALECGDHVNRTRDHFVKVVGDEGLGIGLSSRAHRQSDAHDQRDSDSVRREKLDVDVIVLKIGRCNEVRLLGGESKPAIRHRGSKISEEDIERRRRMARCGAIVSIPDVSDRQSSGCQLRSRLIDRGLNRHREQKRGEGTALHHAPVGDYGLTGGAESHVGIVAVEALNEGSDVVKVSDGVENPITVNGAEGIRQVNADNKLPVRCAPSYRLVDVVSTVPGGSELPFVVEGGANLVKEQF